MRNREPASEVRTADVVVVGGGVIGLAIARALALSGTGRVTLIERARLGAEASSAAGGMLAPQSEADRADEFFALACASRDLYPEWAAALREETGTDIELDRTGTLYLAFTDEDEKEIEHRYLWQARAGFEVERLTNSEALELEPCVSQGVRGALRFPQDVQVENRRLIAALATSVERHGVNLLTETNVESLVIEHGRVAGLETSRGRISAPIVVIACGAWTSFLTSREASQWPVRVEPIRGQMLCFETNPRLARHVIYSPRGYLVPRLDGRLLAGSTTERAGFEKRVTAAGLRAITAHALEIAPALSGLPLIDSWSGLRPRAGDDWPVLGESTETRGLFYATAHYRNGILLAPVTGELIAEQITTNITPPQLRAFGPDRFRPLSVGS